MMASSTAGKFLLTLCALLLMLSTGCANRASNNWQKPDVQLVDAEIVRAKLLEQEFLLKFRIDNPNDTTLSLKRMNYSLTLNGIPLAKDQRPIRVKIPPQGHTYIELPVFTNLWRHVRTLASALKNPQQPISYSLNATISTTGFTGHSFDIARSGSINPNSF